MRLSLRFFLSLIAFILCACDSGRTSIKREAGPEVLLPLKVGETEIQVQVVVSREEQRKGLMNRTELAENAGMLFPYTTPMQMTFWMGNTLLPLDIGFFDSSGKLIEIHHMVPFDTTPTNSSTTQIQYALEMNAGWFARHRIFPGVQLDMNLLKAALRKRGADPAKYGID